MLVAFQRTEEERHLPAAAEHLVRLLRSWGPGPAHLTGLALVGITVPSRLGPRFVDALVFTRSGVVVIAAHSPGLSPGPAERAEAGVAAAKGALAAHDGGRYVTGLVAVVPEVEELGLPVAEVPEQWDRVAEPVGRDAAGGLASRVVGAAEQLDRVAEPGEHEVAAGVLAPEAAAVPEPREPAVESRLQEGIGEGEPGSAWPEPGAGGLQPDPGEHAPVGERAAPWSGAGSIPGDSAEAGASPDNPAPPWSEAESIPGVAVVLADPRGLRRIIGQHNRWRTVWSADDVLDACYALSLAHLAPPRAALLADGFPARLPKLERLPELPAVLPLPPESPAPSAVDEPGPRPPLHRGQAVFPRPRPIRLVPWGLVFVLSLLVAVGVIAAVFVAQVFHGS